MKKIIRFLLLIVIISFFTFCGTSQKSREKSGKRYIQPNQTKQDYSKENFKELQTAIAWYDLNNDGYAQYDEYVGLDKKKFKEGTGEGIVIIEPKIKNQNVRIRILLASTRDLIYETTFFLSEKLGRKHIGIYVYPKGTYIFEAILEESNKVISEYFIIE